MPGARRLNGQAQIGIGLKVGMLRSTRAIENYIQVDFSLPGMTGPQRGAGGWDLGGGSF